METIINCLKINYLVLGEGRPFLILHGWGSRAERWQNVGEYISKNGFKVIIPDLPGFGESQKPQTPWGLDDYYNFIEELAKTLKLEKFYLLGSSFGGALAAKIVIKSPEKVEKLFLVAAACIRNKTIKKVVLKRTSKVLKIFSFLPFYSLIRKKIYQLIRSDYADFDDVMKKTYLKVIEEDLSDNLSSIKLPTVIIWGDKDNITPLKNGRIINKKIIGSKLIIIPGVGHGIRKEAAEVLSKKILESI